MVVTLEVSKLSGWLNADAPCRESNECVRRRQCKRRARGGPDSRLWGGYRACAERTANMAYMVVTLDVSKLSGWLNAVAYCRVERRAYDAGRGAGRGRGSVDRRQRTGGMHGKRARL